MKKEGYCLSSRSWPLFYWFSAQARQLCTALFTSASKASWRKETKTSAPSARNRPSFYLLAASLLLLVSMGISLSSSDQLAQAGPEIALLKRGWQKMDRLPCEGAVPGKFYEIEGEKGAVEIFALAPGVALAPHSSLPDPTIQCREISGPQFIQEIE